MTKIKVLIPFVMCSALLLGCSIAALEPTTVSTSIPVTSSETLPLPTQTEATPPVTEEVHSPLYIPELPVEDVICYFEEVCLSAEYINCGDPSLVQKWTVPLIYRIYGEPTPEDLDTLENFAAQLNHIPGFPGILEAQDSEEAALSIHFCSREDFLVLMGDNFLGADGGVTYWYKENQIYNATIGICTDLDQELRNSVILEELYNGLGPVQDTDLRTDSIIWSGFSDPQELTEVDWLILKLLYHPDLQCGWNAETCETAIRALYY